MTLTGWRSPITLFALLAMGGCAGGSIAGAALDMIGMRKPMEVPESQKPGGAIRHHHRPARLRHERWRRRGQRRRR
jgi:hypothetical protein